MIPERAMHFGKGPAVRAAVLAAAIGLILHKTGNAELEKSATDLSRTESVSTPLTESEQEVAQVWNLDTAEWHRYRALQRGIRGSISPTTLSPLEVLGIHARDASERRHYAELWARAMRDDAERILAFQHAYDKAFKRLFGKQPLIDIERLASGGQQPPLLDSRDRLVFVTRVDCPACDAVFHKIRQHLDRIDGVDIFFEADSADRTAIRSWAKDSDIEPAWVRSRRVTLNEGTNELAQADIDTNEPPLVYVRRNGELQKLTYAEL